MAYTAATLVTNTNWSLACCMKCVCAKIHALGCTTLTYTKIKMSGVIRVGDGGFQGYIAYTSEAS